MSPRGLNTLRPRSLRRNRQRGVALIIALILVSLATILAWKVGYQGYLERRRSIGMLAAEQAVQFGFGAEALAADVLSRDMQMNKQTTLAGPWAQVTQPLPLTPKAIPTANRSVTCKAASRTCRDVSI